MHLNAEPLLVCGVILLQMEEHSLLMGDAAVTFLGGHLQGFVVGFQCEGAAEKVCVLALACQFPFDVGIDGLSIHQSLSGNGYRLTML